MDWKHAFKTFYEGETDDTFIPTGNKYLSSSNIDPSSNPRYLEISAGLSTLNTYTTTASFTEIIPLPQWALVYVWDNNVFWYSTERTSTIWGTSYKNAGWLYNSSGDLKVYVLDATNVYRMNADLSTKESTTAHAWSSITAMCQATNTLIYASGSILYQINNAWSISTALTTLPYWSTIKKLYYYNDILYIFSQNWPDTVIYQARYNGSSYEIIYWHTKEDISIYDMCGSGGKMYWLSNIWFYQTDGQDSQLIKKNTFTSTARCSIYQDNFVYIIDVVYIYRYGTNIPWFPKPFVRLNEVVTTLTALNWITFAEARSSWSVRVMSFSWKNFNWEIVTIPYDAGMLWADKNLEVICFPYELKTTQWWSNTWASIQVQIQTNLMELNNSVTFNNILTLSTLSDDVGICRIDATQILTALGTKTPDFSYFKLKIKMTKSDSTNYSPKVYQDIFVAGSFINDAKVIW